MQWLIRQIIQNSNGALQFDSDFELVMLPVEPIEADVLVSKSGRGVIQLMATGQTLTLVFHTHAWCGNVEIDIQGNVEVHSLYTAEHGFKKVELVLPRRSGTLVTLRCNGKSPPQAKAREVWLAAVEFSEDQSWWPHSQPLTGSCSFTRARYGSFITLTSDVTIGASIVQTGVWAADDTELFKKIVKPGMTVMDIGANIGHHSVLYAGLVGPSGRVLCFEPQTAIFRALCANLLINGCIHADAFACCVGDEEGFVHLYPVDYRAPTNFGALGVDADAAARGSNAGERCRVARLDDLVSELSVPLTRLDFIKIDVQSYELFVLKGGVETIKRFRPTIFLEVAPYWMSKLYDYREIYRFLLDLGYDLHHVRFPDQPLNQIKAWSGLEGEEWDMLAVPRKQAAPR